MQSVLIGRIITLDHLVKAWLRGTVSGAADIVVDKVSTKSSC